MRDVEASNITCRCLFCDSHNKEMQVKLLLWPPMDRCPTCPFFLGTSPENSKATLETLYASAFASVSSTPTSNLENQLPNTIYDGLLSMLPHTSTSGPPNPGANTSLSRDLTVIPSTSICSLRASRGHNRSTLRGPQHNNTSIFSRKACFPLYPIWYPAHKQREYEDDMERSDDPPDT